MRQPATSPRSTQRPHPRPPRRRRSPRARDDHRLAEPERVVELGEAAQQLRVGERIATTDARAKSSRTQCWFVASNSITWTSPRLRTVPRGRRRAPRPSRRTAPQRASRRRGWCAPRSPRCRRPWPGTGGSRGRGPREANVRRIAPVPLDETAAPAFGQAEGRVETAHPRALRPDPVEHARERHPQPARASQPGEAARDVGAARVEDVARARPGSSRAPRRGSRASTARAGSHRRGAQSRRTGRRRPRSLAARARPRPRGGGREVAGLTPPPRLPHGVGVGEEDAHRREDSGSQRADCGLRPQSAIRNQQSVKTGPGSA